MSYLSAPTPSILHRHRRKQSLGAKESSESQYLGDQSYWEHKAAVKAAAEERLRMSLYKSPGQVPSYREEVLSAEGQREELKAAAKRVAAELEARFKEEQLWRLNASPEVERPWTIAALSISPQAADSARRRQHAAAARLNRSLFAEGARHRSEEQEREKAATRSATLQEVSGSADGPKSLLDSVMKLVKFGEQEQEKAATHSGTLQEDSFFNRGASSEKWIAPEHRIRHVNVPAVRASSMPWLAQSPAATPTTARESKPVRQQRDNDHMRVHSRPLWAWDAEPVQKSRR